MHLLLLSAALASEPETWISDDGTVTGVVVVDAPPADVLPVLRDAQRITAIDGSGTRVTPVAPDGACALLDYASPSIFSDIRYRVRQCPTADGVESRLVSSDAFSAYRARWTVTPEGAGSKLRYELGMSVKMLVPATLVQQTSRKAVRRMLDQLAVHFDR